MAKKRRQKEEQKLALCSKISISGFWMSVEDAVTSLSMLPSETKKKAAFKDQLKFRETILCQEFVDGSVFQFSQAKKQFSSQELLENLCKLISVAQELPTVDKIVTNPRLLIGTRIQHRFEDEDGSLTWYMRDSLLVTSLTLEHSKLCTLEKMRYVNSNYWKITARMT